MVEFGVCRQQVLCKLPSVEYSGTECNFLFQFNMSNVLGEQLGPNRQKTAQRILKMLSLNGKKSFNAVVLHPGQPTACERLLCY